MPLAECMNKKQLCLGIFICALGALFYCYEFILRILPGILQQPLSIAFGHLSASAFGQLSALYYVAYSPMQLPVGMFVDRFGTRKLLSIACLCCVIGTWMFSTFGSLPVASCGRFIVGFGSSFVFVGVLSLAVEWLPKRYFSSFAGLMTTLGMLGLVYGEITITHTAASMGLNYVFLVLIFLGIGLSGLLIFFLQDSPDKKKKSHLDLRSFFLQVTKVLCSKPVWIIGVIGACLYTSLSVFGELWGNAYLQQAHHLSAKQAANTISLLFVGWAIGAPLSGFLSDYTGSQILPLQISALGALICISIMLYIPELSYSWVNALMLLYGVFSGAEIIVFVMAKEYSGATLSGTVFAATNMIVTLGGVVFQPLVGMLLDYNQDSLVVVGERIYSVSDYHLALSILPASLILSIILAYFLKNKPVKSN